MKSALAILVLTITSLALAFPMPQDSAPVPTPIIWQCVGVEEGTGKDYYQLTSTDGLLRHLLIGSQESGIRLKPDRCYTVTVTEVPTR